MNQLQRRMLNILTLLVLTLVGGAVLTVETGKVVASGEKNIWLMTLFGEKSRLARQRVNLIDF